MKYGQMSLPKISVEADYLQLDICGLTDKEALDRYLKYNKSIPVILHGDWTKKGYSENNIRARVWDYIRIIKKLSEVTTVYGFTIHPPYRTKVSFEEFIQICDMIENETGISVFIENRSSKKIWFSHPGEIMLFSHTHAITIDLPQLFISCSYNEDEFLYTLNHINWENIKEVHISNVKRLGNHTLVARKLADGEIDFPAIYKLFKDVPYSTLEILGGINIYESEKLIMQDSYINM